MSKRFTSCVSLAFFLVAFCLLGPLLWPIGPFALNPHAVLAAPSVHHPLGTDTLGRDEVARLMQGGTTTPSISAAAAVIAFVIGVAYDFAAGLERDGADRVAMLVADRPAGRTDRGEFVGGRSGWQRLAARQLSHVTGPILPMEKVGVGFSLRGRLVRVLEDSSTRHSRGRNAGFGWRAGSGKSMAALSVPRLLPPGAVLSGRIAVRDGRLHEIRLP